MSTEQYYDVIRAPVITEKATIASKTTKSFSALPLMPIKVIKEAVEALFDVKVKAVNTLRRKGKAKRFRGIPGRQNEMKKRLSHWKTVIRST
ncbi:MAG: 50S ribosomal protein L23 [Hyphomicrobiales bacterium]|nr:MAG: 50S ribosomal protein L23 [Hyphomicrobiales bacterium]